MGVTSKAGIISAICVKRDKKNVLWKNLMLYRLHLILDSYEGLALFRQKQILRSNRHKDLQKQYKEYFFIQFLSAWLHFTNDNFPTPTFVEEILDQSMFLTDTQN